MQLNMYDIIKEPIITEKAVRNKDEQNQYCFVVDKKANKNSIKHAVETIFNVEVKKIQVMNVQGKLKRWRYRAGKTSSWKKAIVKLKAGHKIDLV